MRNYLSALLRFIPPALMLLVIFSFFQNTYAIEPIGIDSLKCFSILDREIAQFTITSLDNNPSASLDGGHLGAEITDENFDFYVSNECDNMIAFHFKTNDLRKLASGKFWFVKGTIHYESADDVDVKGEITCYKGHSAGH